jgi:hypothetical protein
MGHPDQLYGTRLVRMVDGPGDGIRAIEVWNAAGLRFDVLVDRGFDVHRVEYRGRSLHWAGPPGLRSRFAYEPEGWGWLRSFHGGLLVTCGLEHVLFPIERKTPEYHFPFEKVDRFGLHGRIANEGGGILAREIMEEEPVIRLKGEVVQASLYGENLWLRREIQVPVFAPEIRIFDTVINSGFSRTHHELLYHINLGYPLVDAGTRIELYSRGGVETLEATEPQPGFVEQVTSHDLAADEEGFARATVLNESAGLGLELSYRADTLPNFFLWYMMGEGPYVIGLEPSTVEREPRRDPETMSYLEPGEEVRYESRYRVLEGERTARG